MAPRRRSCRLRGGIPENRKITPVTAAKLSSLLERDETPDVGPRSNLDAIVSSPAQGGVAVPHTHNSSPVKTPPSSICRRGPPPEEMHPSHYQQSTTKKPDPDAFVAGLELQTEPVKARRGFGLTHDTPTRVKVPVPGQNPYSSPGFDFRFKRPSSELSYEAQRMMGEVREQAERIKHELVAREAEQRWRDDETEALYGVGGRRIARPKGKVGRFSDVHMEEFKKMDSIADHPSKFRADPARALCQGSAVKRKADPEAAENTPSKATGEGGSRVTLGSNLVRVKSARSFSELPRSEERGMSKRARHDHDQDVAVASITASKTLESKNDASISASRVRSEFGTIKSAMPSLPTHIGINTPTKTSLARSASVKSFKSTTIAPSLLRSPSTRTLPSLMRGARTEGSKKYRNSLAKFASIKGILRRPQPLFSDDPAKVAAGTHLATPKGLSNLNKELPDIPGSSTPSSERKRVNFTNSTISKHEEAKPKPLRPSHVFQIGSPTVQYPCLDPLKKLSASPNTLASPSPVKVRASMPGDFTFRADKEISFGPATTGCITPATDLFSAVRQSDISALVRRRTGGGIEEIGEQIPVVRHGLANKKRRHSMVVEDEDEGEEKENRGNGDAVREDDRNEEGRMSKRAKTSTVFEVAVAGKAGATSRIPRLKGKGRAVLSLSRLNALARPKDRRG